MKKTTPLLACTLLTALLTAPGASAQLFDVIATQGATVYWQQTNAAAADEAGHYWPSTIKTRSDTGGGTNAYSWKGYIQFDLSSALAANGGVGNLTGATLTMYNQNDASRHFDVWGMAYDGQGINGLEGWSAATLTANNAPGNIADSIYGFNTSDVYGGAYLYSMNKGGVNVSADYPGSNTQLARYISPINLAPFLKTHPDGLVTFMIDGYNNMGWYNAPWAGQDTSKGEISPTLNLTFVPEPTTLSLAVLGLGGLFLVRRRHSLARRHS